MKHIIEFKSTKANPIINYLELPCNEYKVTTLPLAQIEPGDNEYSAEIKCNSFITAQAMISLIHQSFDAIMYSDPNDNTKIAINLQYIKRMYVTN